MFVNAIDNFEEVSAPIPGASNEMGQPADFTRPYRVLDRFQHRKIALESFHLPIINEIARHIVNSQQTSQPIRTVRLVGHTDSTGTETDNWNAGGRRAEEARQQLERELERLQPGLSNQIRILIRSCGEFQPVESNSLRQGRAMNRRVEIFLSTRATPRLQTSPAVRRLFENATAAFNARNYGRAIIFYEKARHQQGVPEKIKKACLYNIGLANLRLHRFATAIIYFESYLGRAGISNCDRMMAQHRLLKAKRKIGV
jgi:hypothetical protein